MSENYIYKYVKQSKIIEDNISVNCNVLVNNQKPRCPTGAIPYAEYKCGLVGTTPQYDCSAPDKSACPVIENGKLVDANFISTVFANGYAILKCKYLVTTPPTTTHTKPTTTHTIPTTTPSTSNNKHASTTTTSTSKTNYGLIIGIAIIVLVLLLAAGGGIYYYMKKKEGKEKGVKKVKI